MAAAAGKRGLCGGRGWGRYLREGGHGVPAQGGGHVPVEAMTGLGSAFSEGAGM